MLAKSFNSRMLDTYVSGKHTCCFLNNILPWKRVQEILAESNKEVITNGEKCQVLP